MQWIGKESIHRGYLMPGLKPRTASEARARTTAKAGWVSLYIPTHVAVRLRHGWGTRLFVRGLGKARTDNNENTGILRSAQNDDLKAKATANDKSKGNCGCGCGCGCNDNNNYKYNSRSLRDDKQKDKQLQL
jgi:hypothetical protein